MVPILRVIVLSCVVPYKFCTFDDDFNLAVGQFFINQPKYRTLEVSYGNPWLILDPKSLTLMDLLEFIHSWVCILKLTILLECLVTK